MNKDCPLNMLMKCSKFDKHAGEGFVFLILLKQAEMDTHTYTHFAHQRCYISIATSFACGI